MQKFSEKNKVLALIIGGHGNETSIELASPMQPEPYVFDASDSALSVKTELKSCFKNLDSEASIVLMSCSTGATVRSESGKNLTNIAEHILKESKAKVLFAPTVPTNIESINPDNFEPMYVHGDSLRVFRRPTNSPNK